MHMGIYPIGVYVGVYVALVIGKYKVIAGGGESSKVR